MIRTLYRSGKGGYTTDVPPTHWRVALRDTDGLLWVDFCDEKPEKLEPLLRDVFKFHSLAIEDALRDAHVPRIDNWGDYLYGVVHGVVFNREKVELESREVDIFLGRNFVVTHHAQTVDFVDRLWTNCQSDQRRLERGADFLLYDLLDLLASTYMPVVDAIDDTVDHLEDEVFGNPTQHTLNTLFSVKRVALQMRRLIGPQREVMNRLARDEYAMIDAKDRVYFRDIYDQFVRLADINESLRDLLSGTLDTYLSVTSNRMNEIMKVLTVVTVLFMPMTVLTGFFGMNFDALPLHGGGVLTIAIVIMLVVPLGMFWFFRRRGWM